MALVIFSLAYVFIAGARLPFFNPGRTGAAFIGAAAMVAFKVLTPEQAVAAVDANTLILLIGMMLVSVSLTDANFFAAAAQLVLRVARTPMSLLALLTLISAALSALLVNDTVCLMLTPLVLALVETAELPPLPYLLALCMGANAGSAATFTGNPQNMLIGVASGLPWSTFFLSMLVPSLISVMVVFGVIAFMFRSELKPRQLKVPLALPRVNARLLTLCLLGLVGIVVAFVHGYSMAWSALVGAAVVVLFGGRGPSPAFEKVDWVLLVFFSCLFILVQGVHQEGWAEQMRAAFAPLMAGGALKATIAFSALSLLASNLFSNVPFVMLARMWVPSMPNPALSWEVLALSSTLAGNLTLIGSVANLIVFEGARGKVNITFWQYLRVGVPATLISMVLGIAALLLQHGLLGA